jgi:hypothetical protein
MPYVFACWVIIGVIVGLRFANSFQAARNTLPQQGQLSKQANAIEFWKFVFKNTESQQLRREIRFKYLIAVGWFVVGFALFAVTFL